ALVPRFALLPAATPRLMLATSGLPATLGPSRCRFGTQSTADVGVRNALLGRLCSLGLLFGAILNPATPSAVAVFHRPIVRVGANQSNNWSGYNQGTPEKYRTQFHHVSGTWVVPTA